MTSTFLDLSGSDTPRQVQANLIAYMRLFAGLPGMVMEDADTFWFVSHKPAPGDIVLHAHWSAADCEAQIDALFEAIGQHLDEINLMVFPHDQPADLGQRLTARGLPSGPGGYWLWADLKALGPAPHVAEAFWIEHVRDDRMMAAWVEVSEAGFGEDLALFYDAYARHGYGRDAFSLHYIGYLDDTPVTSGTLLDAGGCAAIYDLSTPPMYRRQGFASALTHALMQIIRDRGYTDTWIWSSHMAQSAYQRLGYIPADFGLREYAWRKSS
jgi:GNAT superfamily N-acetyltransferase